MYTILVIIIVLASIFLTIAVLLQNSKGGGLVVGGGGSPFGVRETAEGLEKATWILAAVIIVCCILATAAISGKKSENTPDNTQQIEKQIQNNQKPNLNMDTEGFVEHSLDELPTTTTQE